MSLIVIGDGPECVVCGRKKEKKAKGKKREASMTNRFLVSLAFGPHLSPLSLSLSLSFLVECLGDDAISKVMSLSSVRLTKQIKKNPLKGGGGGGGETLTHLFLLLFSEKGKKIDTHRKMSKESNRTRMMSRQFSLAARR